MQPDYWNPNPEHPHHRFALGRVFTSVRAQNPRVVMAMNPSYANHKESDRTVNTVIAASSTLGHDGWIMLNLYPERATKPSNLHAFDPTLWAQNWAEIDGVLNAFGVDEVLGAWGDPPNATIRQAKWETLAALKSRGTGVYYYGDLTVAGNPRHTTPRGTPWNVVGSKSYLLRCGAGTAQRGIRRETCAVKAVASDTVECAR